MNPIDGNIPIRPPGVDSETSASRGRESRGASTAASSSSTASESNASGESVTLTREASNLLQLEQQLRDLPSVDQERVNSIQTAISEGRYRVDVDGIVDALLSAEIELR